MSNLLGIWDRGTRGRPLARSIFAVSQIGAKRTLLARWVAFILDDVWRRTFLLKGRTCRAVSGQILCVTARRQRTSLAVHTFTMDMIHHRKKAVLLSCCLRNKR